MPVFQTPDEEEAKRRLVARPEFVQDLCARSIRELTLVEADVALEALSGEVEILVLRGLALLQDSGRSPVDTDNILEHSPVCEGKVVHEFFDVAVCGFLLSHGNRYRTVKTVAIPTHINDGARHLISHLLTDVDPLDGLRVERLTFRC
jgi:hypothetical protein